MEEAQIAPPAWEGKGHHNIDDNDDDVSFATDVLIDLSQTNSLFPNSSAL